MITQQFRDAWVATSRIRPRRPMAVMMDYILTTMEKTGNIDEDNKRYLSIPDKAEELGLTDGELLACLLSVAMHHKDLDK